MQHERQNRNDNAEVDGGLGGRHLEDGGGEMWGGHHPVYNQSSPEEQPKQPKHLKGQSGPVLDSYLGNDSGSHFDNAFGSEEKPGLNGTNRSFGPLLIRVLEY